MKTFLILLLLVSIPHATILKVPADFANIQNAVDAAVQGDTVLVAPGIYTEKLIIEDKSIVLASRFMLDSDSKYIKKTILDGNGETILRIARVDTSCLITGFTFRNGEDGISAQARFRFIHNYVIECKDGIDYEKGSGGICRFNLFEKNKDDAIDLDYDVDIIVEDNLIRDNRDDGIEIRLQPYKGPILKYIIRHNIISKNGEDGIQIIDYPDSSDREIYIFSNIINQTAMAAIGCMADGNTRENYEAASIPEPIFVVNNTLADNYFGISGGDNMVVINNIILNTKRTALHGIDNRSVIQNNCLWNNETHHKNTNWNHLSNYIFDPGLDEDFYPAGENPALNKGLLKFVYKDKCIIDMLSKDRKLKSRRVGAYQTLPIPWDY